MRNRAKEESCQCSLLKMGTFEPGGKRENEKWPETESIEIIKST